MCLYYTPDLNSGPLTKPKMTKTLRSVLNWQTLAQVLSTDENLAKIERMLKKVHSLMENLGVTRKKKGSSKIKGSIFCHWDE